MTKSSEAIISIRPKFAEAILDGVKSIELRRRIPFIEAGTRLWIYATKPTGGIVGFALVDSILRSSPDALWPKVRRGAAVERQSFDDYFAGSNDAVGLFLTKVTRRKIIPLEKLRSLRSGFHPPQVLTIITPAESKILRGLIAKNK